MQTDLVLQFVVIRSKEESNNATMETQMIMTVAHQLVEQKHATSAVYAMVGFSHGLM